MKLPVSILFIISLISCTSAGNREKSTTENQPGSLDTRVELDHDMHDFGLLQAGETVSYAFRYTNTGEGILVISNIESDCGCIHVNYPEKPLLPGESGYIEVVFDTSGLFGKNFKTITIHANVKEPKHLAIFAEVNNEQLEIQY